MYILKFKTPSGESKSFANPNIIKTSPNKYMVSLFMPAEGNFPTEVGDLIYTFDILLMDGDSVSK